MAISRGYNMLDFAFLANIGGRLFLSYKTRKFREQIDTKFIARWCESNILKLNEKCVILNFGDVATDPDGPKYLTAPSADINLLWTKPRLFCFTFGKVFYLLEF